MDPSAKNLTVNIQEQKNDSMLNFTRQGLLRGKVSPPNRITEWKLGQTF